MPLRQPPTFSVCPLNPKPNGKRKNRRFVVSATSRIEHPAKEEVHMKRAFLAAFALLFLSVAALVAAPPGFIPFQGQMYGEAKQGQPAHHSHQS